MKRFSLLILGWLLGCAASFSENVVIKSPGYFKEPIRDGHLLFPDSLVFQADAEEIVIPDLGMFGQLGEYGNVGNFPNLRKITFGNVDYLPGGLLSGLPNLEEVVFDGMIGHFDCTLISNCPKLKRITFKGPVSSTVGPALLFRGCLITNVKTRQ